MLWSQLPNVQWILPHAPSIPITLNGGMAMPGWFDIKTLDRSKRVDGLEDEAGLQATVDKIDALIQLEVDKGIPEDKIVLGGFSQGGAIAALSLLLKNRNLAGYVALSTWIPMPEKVAQEARPNAKDYPVFWGHGTDDQVVRYEYGVQSVELLKKLGFPSVPEDKIFERPGLKFESYPGMQHSSCPEEIRDLAAWLQKVTSKLDQ
ncbi:acyl-protein thioesterase-1 [Trichosporon asahii var. asahii CBS 2479]|uniref:Acyl-protein thioesterase 1 n=1 Tax=Trichosporon asahii var. asahii (strain ATCC 90039 / CBS 2479 / JCM 2466 / KCTC 7840 / NBRC 103889/ NCYC 2677 / UAMH 7654) TaxID=1186058 RepID=J5SKQ6_TRIAS|nr:acyl-protein thioesterase-1 [Trichosporon asahii var. asahii CBS 2479]EJT46151.1 acyl-protein thioesterase-1 [Trichosporon asahii var. asahii CBS 2479]